MKLIYPESLKVYTNFILKNISKYYTFEELSNSNKIASELDEEKILNQLYSDSPYYKMAYIILEKLFFLLELNNFKEQDKEISSQAIDVSDSELLNKKTSSSKELPGLNHNNKINNRKSVKYDEDEFILTTNQQIYLKSLINFLHKNINPISVKNFMQRQYMRAKSRQIGIENSYKYLNDNTRFNINYILNSVGSICYSVRNDIYSNIETVNTSPIMIKPDEIGLLLTYYIYLFNENIYGYSSNLSNLKLLSVTEEEINNESITCYRLKNLNLILYDINILLKFINETKSNFNIETIDTSFVKNIENFINFSIQYVFNSFKNKDNSKVTKLKSDFAEGLRLNLSGLVIY